VLAEAGHHFRILSSTPLRYPEFGQTAFVSRTAEVSDRLPGGSVPARDVSAAGAFEEFVAAAAPGPVVAFLFLDSLHFPPQYAKYLPVDSDLSLLQADSRENTRRMFNRHWNSVL
jgi:hypothetical protein